MTNFVSIMMRMSVSVKTFFHRENSFDLCVSMLSAEGLDVCFCGEWLDFAAHFGDAFALCTRVMKSMHAAQLYLCASKCTRMCAGTRETP